MQRRQLLIAGAGLFAARPAFAQEDFASLARDAWIYTVPLIETAAQRTGVRPNNFVHRRVLADARSRAVTTPNNDTLYSVAHLDLSAGPVTLTLPKTGKRYFSLQLMDAYTNSFRVLGTRTTGGDGGVFTLGLKGTRGRRAIVSPTRHVWALARILVDGPGDLAAVHAIQDGLSAKGPVVPPAPAFARRQAAWPDYLAAADKLLVQDPPPQADARMLRSLRALGIGEGRFAAAAFTAAQGAAIEAGLNQARAQVRAAPAFGGAPARDLGDFGTNYELRAQTAVTGLAALPPAEAVYVRVTPPPGGFDGARLGQLHFPPGGWPPVNAFWSLTLYQPTAEGQFFFVDNPMGRYAIGDRTQGLVKGSDGALDIWISAEDPGPERRANWLPAPRGPYALILRGYLPKAGMMTGTWRPPPILVR